MDDILADLSRPSDVGSGTGTVVPLFARATRWVGGIGGVGVLLAAAATVLVVGLPLLKAGTTPSAPSVVDIPEAPSTALRKSAAVAEAEPAAREENQAPSPVGGEPAASRAAAEAKVEETVAPLSEARNKNDDAGIEKAADGVGRRYDMNDAVQPCTCASAGLTR